ncbi:MAG TPA: energy transducer TonB [Blastocatellia bacterium]|nr:energy transducer TonB [Blastocatellia bacterium]
MLPQAWLKILLTTLISSVVSSYVQVEPQSLPEVILTVAPKIKRAAALVHTGGDVKIEATIDAEGKVKATKVLSGHPWLHQSTIESVSQWRFSTSTRVIEDRTITLTFQYPLLRPAIEPVVVQPYGIKLKPSFDCPVYSDTADYLPSNFEQLSKKCRVHGTFLKGDKVPIIYGLLEYRKGYFEAQLRFFPNENTFVSGGCLIITEEEDGYGSCKRPEPKFGVVAYCQKCRLAASKWRKQHKAADVN